jgi:hypothetical protein
MVRFEFGMFELQRNHSMRVWLSHTDWQDSQSILAHLCSLRTSAFPIFHVALTDQDLRTHQSINQTTINYPRVFQPGRTQNTVQVIYTPQYEPRCSSTSRRVHAKRSQSCFPSCESTLGRLCVHMTMLTGADRNGGRRRWIRW